MDNPENEAPRGGETAGRESEKGNTMQDANLSAFAHVVKPPADGAPKAAWAVWAGRMGIAVFPCRPGAKTPAVSEWQAEATTDEPKIRSWWALTPDANIGWFLAKTGYSAIDEEIVKLKTH